MSTRDDKVNGRWCVVGGGMLGLTLALRLAQQGKRVKVIEAADRIGGLAGAWRLGDVTWDRHYHVILLSDTHLRAVLRELGLEDEIQWVETRTGCYADGQLHSVSNVVELLRFPGLGPVDKLRLGLTLFYGSKIRNGKRLERIPVTDWLVRWSGRGTFRRFWRPLLMSKLGESYKVTSAAFIWAIIARLYAARRTGLKKEMFGYVPGGYARILERLTRVLTEAGVRLELGRPVRRVEAAGEKLRVCFADAGGESFDQVVVTLAAPLAARLCPQLAPTERTRLEGVTYQGIVCASLLLKRPLSEYYVTNILDDGLPFTGVVEMTALTDPRAFSGRALVYLPRYTTAVDPLNTLADEEIERLFLGALERMHPGFRRDDVVAFRISRVSKVLPLATLGYSDRLPPMTTSVPGLHLVNSAHIVNGTLNVNETIQLAERAARMLGAAAPGAGGP